MVLLLRRRVLAVVLTTILHIHGHIKNVLEIHQENTLKVYNPYDIDVLEEIVVDSLPENL